MMLRHLYQRFNVLLEGDLELGSNPRGMTFPLVGIGGVADRGAGARVLLTAVPGDHGTTALARLLDLVSAFG